MLHRLQVLCQPVSWKTEGPGKRFRVFFFLVQLLHLRQKKKKKLPNSENDEKGKKKMKVMRRFMILCIKAAVGCLGLLCTTCVYMYAVPLVCCEIC